MISTVVPEPSVVSVLGEYEREIFEPVSLELLSLVLLHAVAFKAVSPKMTV